MGIAIRDNHATFILYRNEVMRVQSDENHLRIYKNYDIRELTKCAGEVLWLMDNGYYIKHDDIKHILTMDALIEKEKKILMEEKTEYHHHYDLYLYKDIDIEDIQAYYDFELEIEINSMRMKFYRSMAYINAAYIPYKDIDPGNKITEILGEPKGIPENKGAQYNGVGSPYYIVPVSKIHRIIGIKKYRNISKFCYSDYPHTYIREEEFILDLKDFNPDVFMIFKEHDDILSMYYDIGIEAEYIYKDEKAPPKKTKKRSWDFLR